ncbi:MAG TPA: DNA-binding transcriptional regulator Fis [Aeromonadales bacterium]|nr:DNA-binding transcriptional regulator Fis [Aeromonadales bacterium]
MEPTLPAIGKHSSEKDVTNNSEPLNKTPDNQATLRCCVESALKNYFTQLDGQPVTDLYNLVLAEIEAPLMESVLKHTRGNQTQASIMLGLNRGTLRKKLKTYGLN